MSERIHALAQSLLGKSSVEECDLNEIKELVGRYPYFAPAQFLLLQKLKQENSSEYASQLQKAVLYYPDPLEFEYFMASDRFYTEIHLDEVPEPSVTDSEPSEESDSAIEILPGKETVEEVPSQNSTESVEQQMTDSIEKILVKEEQQIDPLSSNNTDLVFEPYHTVDYFASQGIKLSQEEVPKDKFGKQLKSFTEWLKTMKRIPASEVSKNVDASTESKVQHLAEDSVHDADVVTEAMAEVWIKQGNIQKAIETYNKLSLLNPSKRAYFADLIENLKRS